MGLIDNLYDSVAQAIDDNVYNIDNDEWSDQVSNSWKAVNQKSSFRQ